MGPGEALLATPGGAAVRFRIGDPYDAWSCIFRPPLDEGRSGSPPGIEDEDEIESEHDLVAAAPLYESRAGAGGPRSVVAATAEEFGFTDCLGQTLSLFPPVARWLLRRSVDVLWVFKGIS